MNTDTAVIDQIIEQLKLDWDQLPDIDRARRVVEINKQSGLSFRKIAKALGRSESLLRHLRRALLAPAADLIAAQRGKISTNKLVRRAEANLQRQAALLEKSAQQKREKQAAEGAKLICDWLQEHELRGVYGGQIVEEARRFIIEAYFDGSLPHVIPPLHPVSPALIIERCKPKEPLNDDVLASGWYSKWLAGWIVFLLPDSDARDKALDLARKQQSKRRTPRQ